MALRLTGGLIGKRAVWGGLAACLALPVVAQTKPLDMLQQLTKGEWTVKYRDGSPDLKVCVKTGEELIQLRHGKAACSRFVVEDGPTKITVQYTCPKNGYGRTEVRQETRALVQIESQGIASGLPFEFAAEARRTGSCR